MNFEEIIKEEHDFLNGENLKDCSYVNKKIKRRNKRLRKSHFYFSVYEKNFKRKISMNEENDNFKLISHSDNRKSSFNLDETESMSSLNLKDLDTKSNCKIEEKFMLNDLLTPCNVPKTQHVIHSANIEFIKKIEINNTKQILIVDDCEMIRKTVIRLFKQIPKFNESYQIIEGSDGIDIINLIQKDQKNGNKIALVISDENMEYMTGSKAFCILKELEGQKKIKAIPKISLTAFSNENTLNEIKEMGCDRIYNKPISLKILKELYSEFLTN
jgi:CheY-like chemotaxis protein